MQIKLQTNYHFMQGMKQNITEQTLATSNAGVDVKPLELSFLTGEVQYKWLEYFGKQFGSFKNKISNPFPDIYPRAIKAFSTGTYRSMFIQFY